MHIHSTTIVSHAYAQPRSASPLGASSSHAHSLSVGKRPRCFGFMVPDTSRMTTGAVPRMKPMGRGSQGAHQAGACTTSMQGCSITGRRNDFKHQGSQCMSCFSKLGCQTPVACHELKLAFTHVCNSWSSKCVHGEQVNLSHLQHRRAPCGQLTWLRLHKRRNQLHVTHWEISFQGLRSVAHALRNHQTSNGKCNRATVEYMCNRGLCMAAVRRHLLMLQRCDA